MFENFIGQSQLVNQKHGILTRMIDNKQYHSFILYAPVGSGKSTLAQMFLENTKESFQIINACNISLKHLKELLDQIVNFDNYWLLIDEIHRLDNKQQNLLLPYLDQNIKIIGTTSENPYFNLNKALLSRMVIFKFDEISKDEYLVGIKQYFLNNNYDLWDNTLLTYLYQKTKKDIRHAYKIIDILASNYQLKEINKTLIDTIYLDKAVFSDSDSYHYDLISCLQKAIRASDVNASLFYLAALIKTNDLDGIIRRLGIIAYEDIGLANSNLCAKVINALEYVSKIGLPEARIILSNLVIELSLSPKSRSAYDAINKALNTINNANNIQLPKHLVSKSLYNMQQCNYYNNLPQAYKQDIYYYPLTTSRYESVLAQQNEILLKQHREDNHD